MTLLAILFIFFFLSHYLFMWSFSVFLNFSWTQCARMSNLYLYSAWCSSGIFTRGVAHWVPHATGMVYRKFVLAL